MKRDTLAVILILGIPFLIGAALEFLPAWLGIPAIFGMGIIWYGCYLSIIEEKLL